MPRAPAAWWAARRSIWRPPGRARRSTPRGSALIRASAAAGAVMAGATQAQLAAIERFASELGLAFQIVDDILDVAGASADLGKTAGKDAAAGKPTYPALYGLDESRRMADECVQRALAALQGFPDSHLPAIARWVLERRTGQFPWELIGSRELRSWELTKIPRSRLDAAMVANGLAASRERARALILAGQVRVNGAVVSKAGTPVAPDAEIALVEPDHPYVGRGGVKLAHALEACRIDPTGRLALDVGASTGGFTDVMLRRGARRVVALDVGHGQLDWTLRNDPRVAVVERVNARTLTPGQLPEDARVFDLVTMDVSFISVRQILPAVVPLLASPADVIVLVKPQFEAGRDEVGKGGLVRDAAVQARVVEEVAAAADALGLTRVATIESPITGTEGNREFFLHLRHE